MTQDSISIAFGQIRHRRLRPSLHAFQYGAFFLRIPIHALGEHATNSSWLGIKLFGINSGGLLSFFEKDHGDGGDCRLWINHLLDSAGLAAPKKIWLHAFPRMLGYAFKPVSFWFCHDDKDVLTAIIAEVNNTFNEKHIYLLSGSPKFGQTLQAEKVFHVSPFCDVQGSYSFRFLNTPTHCVARVDHLDNAGPLIQTSMSGQLSPLSESMILKALSKYPLFTFAVIARIHWHALQLWRKKVPFFSKPKPPNQLVTHHST